ncbi:hypothetical protein C8F01DRAFT_448470 [Mycena amicta]|nr:hypothetical protein C8F01DRAFT_448470 [Mycena amicta]
MDWFVVTKNGWVGISSQATILFGDMTRFPSRRSGPARLPTRAESTHIGIRAGNGQGGQGGPWLRYSSAAFSSDFSPRTTTSSHRTLGLPEMIRPAPRSRRRTRSVRVGNEEVAEMDGKDTKDSEDSTARRLPSSPGTTHSVPSSSCGYVVTSGSYPARMRGLDLSRSSRSCAGVARRKTQALEWTDQPVSGTTLFPQARGNDDTNSALDGWETIFDSKARLRHCLPPAHTEGSRY